MYILNTLMVPVDFEAHSRYTVYLTKITPQMAREFLEGKEFVSAVGHEATAKVLSELLGINVPCNRITVRMRPWDSAIHFVLRTRLPEGVVLNEEELRQLDFDLVLSTVVGY
jgi:hypothetical protein